MSKINLCIIGAGEVVRERYSRGLSVPNINQIFDVRWIYDVIPDNEALLTLKRFPNAVYQQIPSSVAEATHQIIKEVPSDAVVIIATPIQFHIPYALKLLGKFRLIVIEKPLTKSEEEYLELESKCLQLGCFWFPLAYYLIEKGLPYLLLICEDFRVDPYLQLVKPRLESELFKELQRDLGTPRKLVGCILEGAGSSGTLDDRQWVLTTDAGGNTWETLFHLSSLIAATCGTKSGNCSILQSYRGIISEAKSGSGFISSELEDTAHLVSLTINQLYATIFSAKYLSSNSHQRWLQLECDGGIATIDFSSTAILVETKNDKIHYQLTDPTPYVTQFSLLARVLEDIKIPLPSKVYREAFNLNRQIYEFGKQQALREYERGLYTQALINQIGGTMEMIGLWQISQSVPRL